MGWPGPVTERQLIAFEEFLEADYALPSRSDQYVMYAGHLARHVNSRRVPPFRFGDYRLDFGTDKPLPGQPAPISEARRKELLEQHGIRAPRPVTKDDLVNEDRERVRKSLARPLPANRPPPLPRPPKAR